MIATGSAIAAAEFTVAHIIEPLLFGTKTRLSPLAVLIAAAFWTTLWGPVGLILALPLTLGLVVFGEHIPHLAFLRVLLGNNPALTAEQRLYHLLLAGDASEAAEEAAKFLDRSLIGRLFRGSRNTCFVDCCQGQQQRRLAPGAADRFEGDNRRIR